MSDRTKTPDTTAKQDEEKLPDLAVANDATVKAGLNFTKVEYKNIAMLG
jgi:hypothetical protein